MLCQPSEEQQSLSHIVWGKAKPTAFIHTFMWVSGFMYLSLLFCVDRPKLYLDILNKYLTVCDNFVKYTSGRRADISTTCLLFVILENSRPNKKFPSRFISLFHVTLHNAPAFHTYLLYLPWIYSTLLLFGFRWCLFWRITYCMSYRF